MNRRRHSHHDQQTEWIRERILREAAESWGDFLHRLPFDWFLTLTFPTPVHPEQAAKRWQRWVATLQRHPDRAGAGPLVWARAEERQTRGVIHFHGLLAGIAGIPRMAAIRLWERAGGGWGRIEIYRQDLRGSYYVAKRGDIELSPSWFSDSGSSTPARAPR